VSSKNRRINLHEALKKGRYDHALISTFTFSPRFFEEYALERFESLSSARQVTVLLDRGEYEEIIKSVAGEAGWAPKKANRSYLLHPMSVPGVFHPKVFLFVRKDRGLLVIGSANFTQNGLGKNAEMVSIFEFERTKNEETSPLFQSALQFFRNLLTSQAGSEALSRVDDACADAPWLVEPLEGSPNPELPKMLTNIEEPLWDQLVSAVSPGVDEMRVVSRFFDASPKIMERVFDELGVKSARIYTQSQNNTLTPEWMDHALFREGLLGIHMSEFGEGDVSQSLHAKAYVFRKGDRIVFAFGSANLSTPALMRPAKSGNVEVLLLYPPMDASEIDCDWFFDPEGTGADVKNLKQLGGVEKAENEMVSRVEKVDLIITGARLMDEGIECSVSGNTDGLSIRISQGDRRAVILGLNGERDGRVVIPLKSAQVGRLKSAPTVIQLGLLVDGDWEGCSNLILIEALQDPGSGRDAQQERQIRAAKESPERFMKVLFELCNGDDEGRLRTFLTHVDIPMEMPFRVLKRSGGRSSGEDDKSDGFKNLGERNLRHFELLHDAIMDFSRRHRRRLSKCVDTGTAAQIPAFLHILESAMGLLVSQIERVVAALDSSPSKIIMTADRWHELRINLATYYGELEAFLELTSDGYLMALIEAGERAKVVEGFAGRDDIVLGQCSRALQMRDKVLRLCKDRIGIDTGRGIIASKGFFKSRLSNERWPSYVRTIQRLGRQFRGQCAG